MLKVSSHLCYRSLLMFIDGHSRPKTSARPLGEGAISRELNPYPGFKNEKSPMRCGSQSKRDYLDTTTGFVKSMFMQKTEPNTIVLNNCRPLHNIIDSSLSRLMAGTQTMAGKSFLPDGRHALQCERQKWVILYY